MNDDQGDIDRTQWFLRHVLPHEAALRGWLAGKYMPGLEVDDIVQESYAVLASMESVADIRHPRAYLFQVAHSLVVRNIRRSRVVMIEAVDDLHDCPDDAATPEQSAVGRDELRYLAETVAAMPPRTREAFVLRRIHDLPQREIARRMNLSESTVEKHIARGLRKLRDRSASGGRPSPAGSRMRSRRIPYPRDVARNRAIVSRPVRQD